MLLDKQAHITPYRGMPVEMLSSGSATSTLSGSVTLYYFNAGVLTADASQAAWTLVIGKLPTGNIMNILGSSLANYNDSSLTVTSTALTTLVASTPTTFEAVDTMWLESALKQIAGWLWNWQYIVDYAKGIIYWKKTTTSAAVSVSYTTNSLTASSGSYKELSVRAASELTTSYVAGTVLSNTDYANQLILYVSYTKWSSSSAEIKIEFSNDWTNYYQESFGTIAVWVSTVVAGSYQIWTAGSYRIPVSIKDKYIKISAKCTWTVTSSSMTINAIVGNQ